MTGKRRDRSRSPMNMSVDKVGRRRESGKNNKDNSKGDMSQVVNNMNPMMMGGMYQQGNMMMGGMYPNMMMPNGMMGAGMMPTTTGMEMMPSTSMDMMQQPSMDMSTIGGSAMPTLPATGGTPIDMNMMGGMLMDPSIMGMYSNMGNMSGEMTVVEKKEIELKHCKLIPPAPGTPDPPRRQRPPGCRTIFIGGLPDKIRESIVREVFENYGRIQTLRLSKKNFCHIRFDRESCVDTAMLISGYRLKLINKDKDKKDGEDEDEDSQANSGWLHVDYALSRDDQNEFERRQRQVLRAQEQQMQQLTAQQEMANRNSLPSSYHRRGDSPVRITPFSNLAINQIAEKIKSEEQFSLTLPTLVAWLERGECSKKNANQFYSMIQATNSHIRRLFNEKMQAEEELQEARERVKSHIEKVIEQLEQVGKVFTAATHQRVWDHFTKPQRKNIETWQKMTQEFSTLKEEFNEKFQNSEDNDGYNNGGYNNMNQGYDNQAYGNSGGNNEDTQNLKRENDSLRFQLEAYKNEVDVIKADAQKEMEKFKAQFIARQALNSALEKNPPLPKPVEKPPPPPPLPEDLDAKVLLKESVEAGCGEAKLIGVMSAFLQVHPHGASLDYVVSYVRALFPHVTQATVHRVLQKHADVFLCATQGVGANIEKRWLFNAYTKEDVKPIT